MLPSSYPDARRAGPAGDGSGVSSPSRTKPNPPAMPCQGVPGLALPRLPLPLARPDPRGTSLWCNGPLSRSVPGPVRSGKARRAFVRNGKAQDIRERGQVPGPLPAGCLLTDGDTQVSAAPPPSRCVASKASGRGPLLPFPRPCVAHLLSDPTRASRAPHQRNGRPRQRSRACGSRQRRSASVRKSAGCSHLRFSARWLRPCRPPRRLT
jgi:hypothetical protein